MAGRIFVNYRRGDDPGFTQALYQKLETEFGRDALFMDVEGFIKAGDDFVHVLNAQVAQSDVVLAVIGPRWLDSKTETGVSGSKIRMTSCASRSFRHSIRASASSRCW